MGSGGGEGCGRSEGIGKRLKLEGAGDAWEKIDSNLNI